MARVDAGDALYPHPEFFTMQPPPSWMIVFLWLSIGTRRAGRGTTQRKRGSEQSERRTGQHHVMVTTWRGPEWYGSLVDHDQAGERERERAAHAHPHKAEAQGRGRKVLTPPCPRLPGCRWPWRRSRLRWASHPAPLRSFPWRSAREHQ